MTQTTALCETFRALAFRTHDQLGRGRRVGHQPLEETFTDTNILELKDRHPTEIHCRAFTKYHEGVNGADWEWWLTNSSMSTWLGLRVQAKVLHLESDTFFHLHYRSGKSRTYQLAKLKRACAKEGLIPLYCFYVHNSSAGVRGLSCSSFAYSAESYGCSLAPLAHVEALQKRGEVNDLTSVLSGALPWHCLVCCKRHGGTDLPTWSWSLISTAFGLRQPTVGKRPRGKSSSGPAIGPRSQAPSYVYAALEGRESDVSPRDVRGILVVQEREGG